MKRSASELFIVDNSDADWKVRSYLKDWCELSSAIDIATGYFEIGALLTLDEKWQAVDQIRILLGDEVSLRTKRAFAQSLQKISERLDASLENEKGQNDFLKGVPAIVEAIRTGKIACRVYRKEKFHAKAYLTHGRAAVIGSFGLVGSSNFTYPGLTDNVELNVQIRGADVGLLQEWYERHWNEAEDVSPDLLRTIERHTRDYSPFEVWVKALDELMRGHELTPDEWDREHSRLFPILAKYQQDAYKNLVQIADRFGSAFLCDGVGLGKTFVGLMLLERMVVREGKRVVLFAPKAAREDVWERAIQRYLPHLNSGFVNFVLYNHTDLQRKGRWPRDIELTLRDADVVLIDEAHHFRNPGIKGEGEKEASRYRLLQQYLQFGDRPKQLFMLTATPVNNSIHDFRHMIELAGNENVFATQLGIHNLRSHFNQLEKHLLGKLPDDIQLDLEFGTEIFAAEQALRTDRIFDAIVVQRSRGYVKQSQQQQNANEALFPEREAPGVIAYNLKATYGKLLTAVEQAFNKKKPLFVLGIYYPLAYWKGDTTDPRLGSFDEGRQKQVVTLIRTLFLKRFESSARAFEGSCWRLMQKLLAWVTVHSQSDHDQRRLERWKIKHGTLINYSQSHNHELWPDEADEDQVEEFLTEDHLAAVEQLDADLYKVDEIIDDTFLVEVIDVIHSTLAAKWQQQRLTDAQQRAAWNDYVPQHLLPRLHAYELMMAPYAIAHMKIGLKLAETGYRFGTEERARIYLTNALEPWQRQLTLPDFEALAHEATAVNEIKRDKRFTVVIGNPPYSVSSWNKGEWITKLAEDYKRTVRAEESQIQSLSNDYIKFLRFGEWHVKRTNIGILGLITGHGYLSGTQPRDLRNHVSTSFDRCLCLDLHGSVRRAGTNDTEDEPVFEIMTGVAIFVGYRAISHQQRAETLLESLTGRLGKKFAFLREHTALKTSLGGNPHSPSAPYFHFAATATAHDIGVEYQRWPDLPAIFGTGNRQADKEIFWATGSASQQDELAMSFTRDELEEKMAALKDSRSFDQLKEMYRLCTTNQWNYSEAKEFAKQGMWKQHVGQVAYRPFDRQWTVLHKHVLTILRKQVMSQFGGKERNLGLVSSRAVNDLSFAHCFVTNEPVDKIFISSKTSTNAYVFPLFFRDDDIFFGIKRRPNLSRSFLTLLAEMLAVTKTAEHGLPAGLTPEDIFHYVYAVFHSPNYRRRYAEFLKIDFPRLPLTRSLALFRALARLGGELVALHLLESPKVNTFITRFVGEGDNSIPKKPTYRHGAVWINASQRFEGVPEAVWNFHVGGYQVCEKWLKDRKGRTLSADDIAHYQRVVVALNETIRLMDEIDRAIEAHGGWPGAFQAENAGESPAA